MIAGMVLSNLFYVVGAIVAATLVSAVVLLRHRRPKSLEAGIEMFSRELRALQPERRQAGSPDAGPVVLSEGTRQVRRASAGYGPQPDSNGGREGQASVPNQLAGRRSGAVKPLTPAGSPPKESTVSGHDEGARGEALAPSPNRENEPG